MRRFVIVCLLGVVAAAAVFDAWALYREHDVRGKIAPVSGSFIRAHDVELFVQTEGDPQGQPVILVHGMAAWSEGWRETITALDQAGYRVIAVDMPPFGFSERPEDRSYWREAQAERLIALSATLKMPPIIIAHSYGSRGALEAILERPDAFRGLVMVDPALDAVYDVPSAASSAARLFSVPPVRYSLTALTMTNPLLSKMLLQLFMHQKDAATDAIVAMYRRPSSLEHSTRDLGHWVYGFLSGADTGRSRERDALRSVSIPVGLIWGREDTTTPLEQGRALQILIPHAGLTVLDDVGHMPHLEDPARFNAALLEMLRDL